MSDVFKNLLFPFTVTSRIKFWREVNENTHESRTKKSKKKILNENKDNQLEECNASDCRLGATSSALSPPRIRKASARTEKGIRWDRKGSNTSPVPGAKARVGGKTEMNTDPDRDRLKTNFQMVDDSSSGHVIEVNIGHEADFAEEAGDAGEKMCSAYRIQGGKPNHRESNNFGQCRDDRTRAAKTEVTSIDVVVPAGDAREEYRKMKARKTRNKVRKRTSAAGLKSEETFAEPEPELFCPKNEPPPNGMKQSDARLLLICGKNAVDSLTEEDVSLLREMKNQIGHKEGLEKLFNEIRDSAFLDSSAFGRNKTERIRENEEGDKTSERFKRIKPACKSDSDPKDSPVKSEERENKIFSDYLTKWDIDEDDKKYFDEIRRHYDKKKWGQQKSMKHSEEGETEKKKEKKWKTQTQRINSEKDRKSRSRHGECSAMERAVTETLQKFIEIYRFQIPPHVVNNMKKNILKALQSEYPESGPKKNLDVVLAVQEELKYAEAEKGGHRSRLMEAGEEPDEIPFNSAPVSSFLAQDESIFGKDCKVENGNFKSHSIRIFNGSPKEKRSTRENDVGEDQNLKQLKNDFEKCLKAIKTQLDITGTKLYNVVLEKNESEDLPHGKVRIAHNFLTGVTESIKICKEKLNMGTPHGDNTSVKVCHCYSFEGPDLGTKIKERKLNKNSGRNDMSEPFAPRLDPDTCGKNPEVPPEDGGTECKEPGAEACEIPGSDRSDPRDREVFNSISERLSTASAGKKICRVFKSDCLGLNKIELGALIRGTESGTSFRDLPPEDSAEREEEEEEGEEEEEEEEGEEGLEPVKNAGREQVSAGNAPDESYHVGCVWLWNGKKMDPGVDLKVHVEDLLQEKLKEILKEVQTEKYEKQEGDAKDSKTNTPESDVCASPARIHFSDKNLETRKTLAKFCIAKARPFDPDVAPFIFKGSKEEEPAHESQVPKEGGDDKTLHVPDPENVKKSVREVGIQNSRLPFSSAKKRKPRWRPKRWRIKKFGKNRSKKNVSARKTRSEKSRTVSPKWFSFAENVGEAKKVKLEIRESNEGASNLEKERNPENIRKCFSLISNESSSSGDGPVRVKFIGIEVSKEKKCPGPEETYDSSRRSSEEETCNNAKENQSKYKHWELIENVLNRVSQKEKDTLWNDIREFVQKKIDRDINDEEAREVCIEIEQDFPKFSKGKSNHSVVAKGSYTKSEGDVQVEVDLTLDDLERILRHRQKKIRRRPDHHSRSKITSKVNSKKSLSSSNTSSDAITAHFGNCGPFADGGYVAATEFKSLRQEN